MTAADVVVSLIFLGSMSMSLLLIFGGRKHRRMVQSPTTKAVPSATSPALDWCDGCDQVKPETKMAFTEGGLYRCATCRGEPEPVNRQKKHGEDCRARTDQQTKEWLKAKKEMAPLVDSLRHLVQDDSSSHVLTGRHIELNSVAEGQQVIAQGGGASIVVHGNVGPRATLIARGGEARIVIEGYIGVQASVIAQGGNAQIRYYTAAPSAKIVAQGGGSRVKCLTR